MIVKLKSIGTFVDTDTLISMLNGNKKVDKKYFHLSFDDGFKNNFTNAFPILLKHDGEFFLFQHHTLVQIGV